MPRRSGYGPAVSSGVTAHAAFVPVPPPFAEDDDVVVVSGDVVDPPQPIAATMLLRPSLASASRLFITSPCPHHAHQHNCHISRAGRLVLSRKPAIAKRVAMDACGISPLSFR